MRKLLVAILILVLLGVVAEVAARRVAEDRVASRLKRTFDLSSEPDVQMGGVPFLLELVRGDVSEITMSAGNVRSEDVRLDDVTVNMRNVRFSLSDLADGSGKVRVGEGDGSASITERSLNEALAERGAPFEVTLGPQGVTATSAAAGLEANADVTLDGDALSLSGSGLPAVSLDLPSLGGRVTYEGVSTSNGRATVRFSVKGVQIAT